MPIHIAYFRHGETQKERGFPDYGLEAQNFVTVLVRSGFVVSISDPTLAGAADDHGDDERRAAQGA